MTKQYLLANLLLFCFVQMVNAQPVTLDPTFGQDGISVIPNTTEIRLLEFDNSGNIIAVGYTLEENKYYLTVVKTNSEGALDLNFGNNGIVKGTEINKDGQIGLRITNGNKIFITGSLYVDQYEASIRTYLQYNEDGSVDETFGENGKIIISNTNVSVTSLHIENDDFLLFGGYDSNPPNDPLILKRKYDGTLDESFGENGIVYLTDNETYRIYPVAIKILRDLSILIVGNNTIPYVVEKSAFCKISSNGNLVTEFANNGICSITSENPIPEIFEGLVGAIEDNEGNIVLHGSTYHMDGFQYRLFICSFHSNGIINSYFGKNGFFNCYNGGAFLRPIYQNIIQNGNKYIAVFQDKKIISINNNGTLDTMFNNTGIFICENYYFKEVKFQGTNKLILGGSYNDSFSLVRLNIQSNVSAKQPTAFDSSNIFPNPAKDILYLKTEAQFEIFDISGRKQKAEGRRENAVDISSLNKGIYFIRFEDGRVEKFVKE